MSKTENERAIILAFDSFKKIFYDIHQKIPCDVLEIDVRFLNFRNYTNKPKNKQ